MYHKAPSSWQANAVIAPLSYQRILCENVLATDRGSWDIHMSAYALQHRSRLHF